MQYAGAVGGAAHTTIGDAYHVAYSPFQKFLRDGEHAPLGHARSAERTHAPQHEHRALVDVERWAVDALREVVVAIEDHGGAGMPEQARIGRGMLYDAAVGGQVAVQHGKAAFGVDRFFEGSDNPIFKDLRAREVLTKGAAAHRKAPEVECRLQADEETP